MPVIDYKEIPKSKASADDKGTQDKFELFARDYLEFLGYRIVENPDRGADGGRDIIAEETRSGVGGETTIRWLVSCKHTAHSGKSVTPHAEQNIKDRVESNNCKGFIGFYSMLPSSGLTGVLDGLRSSFEVQILDGEHIEKSLLASSDGITLARRYFPRSMEVWASENPRPADIFLKAPRLLCNHSGTDLLDPNPKGIVVLGEKSTDGEKYIIEDVYWSQKGHADRVLEIQFQQRGLVCGWEDIPDVMIPLVYLKWVLMVLSRSKDGEISDPAFNKLKTFLMALFPYVTRNMTTDEKRRLDNLFEIPSFLGGMGGY